MIDTDATKAKLEARLAELHARRDNTGRDLAEPLNADSSEQAVEVQDDAALEGQGALVEREIASIRRAIERIESGAYGECARCGADIAPARPAVRPEAALCIACARSEQ